MYTKYAYVNNYGIIILTYYNNIFINVYMCYYTYINNIC